MELLPLGNRIQCLARSEVKDNTSAGKLVMCEGFVEFINLTT